MLTKSNIQALIQRTVINSSFFPLTYLYRKIYNLSTAVAALLLRRVEEVAAIYLRRGAAQGEIVYGLSDIDLLVIVNDQDEDSTTKSAKTKVRAIYDGLSRFIPLFGSADRELGLYSTSEFLNLYDNYDSYRYRFHSGRHTWKLLFGQDIVKVLPEIPDSELYLPATEELKTWWEFLNVELTPDFVCPAFKRKYLWYKAISEASKIYLFVCHGKNIESRKAALSQVRDYLPDTHHWHLDRIQGYLNRLTAKEDLAPDDLVKLFITLVSKTFEEMERKVYGSARGKMATVHFSIGGDWLADRDVVNQLRELETSIREELEPYLEHIALIPGVEFNVDVFSNSDIDSLYLGMVQKDWIPVEKLKKVRRLLTESLLAPEIEPFIVIDGNIALSLQADKPAHGIKSRGVNPLFFSLLHSSIAKPGKSISEEDVDPIHCYLPPGTFEETIRKRMAKIGAATRDKNIYKMKTLDFLRFFWAAARTRLLSQSLGSEEIHIPLTSRQIRDMMLKSYPADSDWLTKLHQEYTKELLGQENESYRFFSESIDFLNRV